MWLQRNAKTFAIVILLLFACSEESQNKSQSQAQNPTDKAQAKSGLTAVKDCGDLETYIKDVALSQVEKALEYYENDKPLPMPVDGDDVALGVNEAESNDGSAAPTSDGGSSSPDTKGSSTPTYSGTNVQEQGVDEADLVKTDGNYLYIISGRTLRILKSLPAEQTAEVGALDVGAGSFELFVHGDRALVYSKTYGDAEDDSDFGGASSGSGVSTGSATTGTANTSSAGGAPDTGDTAVDPVEPTDEPEGNDDSEPTDESEEGDSDEPEGGAAKPGAQDTAIAAELRGSVVRMTVVNLADRTQPTVERIEAIEGRYVSARMVGGQVHTVIRGHLFVDGPSKGFSSVDEPVAVTVDVTEPPSSTDSTSDDATDDDDEAVPAPAPAEAGKADMVIEEDDKANPTADELKALFKAYLDKLALDDILPRRVHVTADGAISVESLADCTNFYKPSFQLGLDLVTIVSTDLGNADDKLTAITTLGGAGTVYASKTAIYAASYVYDYWFYADDEDKNNSEFTAIHKFAFSDSGIGYTGSGKVAGKILNQFSMGEHNDHLRVATTERNWATDGLSTNSVFVMGEKSGQLEITGEVTGLAKDEQIYSARFIGDRGYVVTFKRIDPLFTLDLSDPTAPKVAGELKIPGFSTYIHPLGDNHLLTIGRDAEDNGDWVQIQGVQLQIFDVSDLANPKVAHKATLDTHSSEALYNHKAFSYFEELGVLAIPFGGHGGGMVDGGAPILVEPSVEVEETTEEGEDQSTDLPTDADGEPTDSGDGETEGDTTEIDEQKPTPPSAGVMVFNIDADKGISEFGVIDHQSLMPEDSNYWHNVAVRRTILIEDHLYTVGNAGVKVNKTSDLSEVAAVAFPEEDLCGGYDWCDGGNGGPLTPSNQQATQTGDPDDMPTPEPNPEG